ncbi:MAG TPA: amino acid racemase [Sphingomonadales bacterium]|nr:amino acid racemase [Sphingomonadales bacterium]
MKIIGICANSAEGSSLCYLECVHAGEAELGAHFHPEIALSCIAMGESLGFWESGDYPAARAIFAESIEKLAAAGADFFIVPDNTAHIALEAEGGPLALPGLHIAEVVAETAKAKGFKTLALLGTKWTMEGPVYPASLARRGIKHMTPGAEERAFVDATIFGELCRGIFNPETIERYCAVIEGLKKKGCDSVILGCTEIPIIINEKNSALPVLDSTRLLARAAVRTALGQATMPTWRGGPL